jgi:hypothetical protein
VLLYIMCNAYPNCVTIAAELSGLLFASREDGMAAVNEMLLRNGHPPCAVQRKDLVCGGPAGAQHCDFHLKLGSRTMNGFTYYFVKVIGDNVLLHTCHGYER